MQQRDLDQQDEQWYDAEDDRDNLQERARRFARVLPLKILAWLLQYPFESTQLLLSIQHLPRPEHVDASSQDDFSDENIMDDSASDTESLMDDDNDDESEQVTVDHVFQKPRVRRDPQTGYVVSTRPEYQLAPQRGTLTRTIRSMMRHRYEGFLSLWKGVLPYMCREIGVQLLQPALEDFMNEQFDLFDNRMMPLAHQPNFVPNLLTSFTSHVVAKVLFSPLEIMQVRMIAQSSDPLHRSFPTSLHALCGTRPLTLKNLARSMYPEWSESLLFHAISHLASETQTLIIKRLLRISPKTWPIYNFWASFGLMTLELMVVLPLRTVRWRRMLYEQPHHGIKSEPRLAVRYPCISLSERGYTGIFSSLATIIRTEAVGTIRSFHFTSDGRKVKRKKRGLKWGFVGGIAQLYRGFWPQTYSNFLLCLLAALSGLALFDETDPYYF